MHAIGNMIALKALKKGMEYCLRHFNRSRHENGAPKDQLRFTINLSFIERQKGEFV